MQVACAGNGNRMFCFSASESGTEAKVNRHIFCCFCTGSNGKILLKNNLKFLKLQQILSNLRHFFDNYDLYGFRVAHVLKIP